MNCVVVAVSLSLQRWIFILMFLLLLQKYRIIFMFLLLLLLLECWNERWDGVQSQHDIQQQEDQVQAARVHEGQCSGTESQLQTPSLFTPSYTVAIHLHAHLNQIIKPYLEFPNCRIWLLELLIVNCQTWHSLCASINMYLEKQSIRKWIYLRVRFNIISKSSTSASWRIL